ncbi:hypothetical protein ACWEU6_05180 [Streptosporangium sandarakinum]
MAAEQAAARRGERMNGHTWPSTIEEHTGRAAAGMLPDLAGGER